MISFSSNDVYELKIINSKKYIKVDGKKNFFEIFKRIHVWYNYLYILAWCIWE